MQNVKRQFINCVHKQIKNFARDIYKIIQSRCGVQYVK